jgi:hypothetical protein
MGAMERSDWPLLLISREALGVEGPEALDPVRIQKGMFLLSVRGPLDHRNTYQFQPYDWGPFSRDVAADLDVLSFQGLLATELEPGRTWVRYVTTEKGNERAHEVAEMVPSGTVEWLGMVRRFLTTRSFTKLLTDVYEMYPDYAVNSRFSR